MTITRSDEPIFFIPLEKSNVAKGVALIFVITSHLPRVLSNYNLSFLNPLGYLGVGLFLFLSGYGLELSSRKKGIDGYWRKRVIRIIPALAITTILIFLLKLLIDGKAPCSIGVFLLSSLGLSNYLNPVTWYLSMMWFCYVVFWLIKRFGCNTLLWAGVLSLSIYLLSIIFTDSSLNLWGLNSFSFAAGLVCTDSRFIKYFKKRKYIFLTWTAFVILFFVYYILLGNSEVSYWRNLAKSVLSVLFLIGFVNVLDCIALPSLAGKILSWLGAISYEAFLIHALFIFEFPGFFSIWNKGVMLIVFGILTVMLSYALNRGIGFIIVDWRRTQ
jgi:peptidoglycan/LPS O-acetylase OafA/YrhL